MCNYIVIEKVEVILAIMKAKHLLLSVSTNSLVKKFIAKIIITENYHL